MASAVKSKQVKNNKITKKKQVSPVKKKSTPKNTTKKKKSDVQAGKSKSLKVKTNKKIEKKSQTKKSVAQTKEAKTKSNKNQIDSSKKRIGEEVVIAKPMLLPRNSMKKTADEEPKHKLIATPTDQMLKPFRDAAKKLQVIVKEKKKSKSTATFIAKPIKSAKKVFIDLRVHSPASEGYLSTGGVDPASAMVRLAKAKGLDMIAVTDYHSAEFVDIVKVKAQNTSVTIIPGLDLKCVVGNCNEVSMVALFPENYTKDDLDKVLAKLGIPDNKKGLKSYTIPLSVKEIISAIESNGGVIIPSRLDITPNRMRALHELIESHGFHVFDLAHPDNPEYFKEHWPSGEFTFLSFSNANALGQIGTRASGTKLPDRGFNAIKTLASRRSCN